MAAASFLCVMSALLAAPAASGAPPSEPTYAHTRWPDHVSPTAAFLIGEGSGDGGSETLGFWLGATYHPARLGVSPFVGGGVDVELVHPGDDTLARDHGEATPQVRFGVAILRETLTWHDQTFPSLEAYALGGWRFAGTAGGRGNAPRLGVGLSVLDFGRVQGHFCAGTGAPVIPWMIELDWDLGVERERWIRLGYQF